MNWDTKTDMERTTERRTERNGMKQRTASETKRDEAFSTGVRHLHSKAAVRVTHALFALGAMGALVLGVASSYRWLNNEPKQLGRHPGMESGSVDLATKNEHSQFQLLKLTS